MKTSKSNKLSGGCSCYDWQTEILHYHTFKWFRGSWVFKNRIGGWRRIYYCPMCGSSLKAKSCNGKKQT